MRWLVISGLVMLFGCLPKTTFKPIDKVNPFIGTYADKVDLEGRTHPGALVPFGMVSVCPFNAYDTSLVKSKWNHRRSQAPYFHNRSHISGFSHVNLSGVGCPELGVVLTMPTRGKVQTEPSDYFSTYSKEEASPGYYTTHLDRYDIDVETSATIRTGVSKYTFSAGQSNVLINLGLAQTNVNGASIHMLSGTKAEGFRNYGNFCGPSGVRKVFYAIELSKPAENFGVWRDGQVYTDLISTNGDDIGGFFQFTTEEKEEVLVKVAISYVSAENAWENMEVEQPGFDFEKVKNEAEDSWNEELSKIIVDGGSQDDETIFYTALYHCLIHPNIYNDVNGQYRELEGDEIVTSDHDRYTTFSLWDTYRNVHSLFSLVYPDRQIDMVKSMLDMYEESGWLPKWELSGSETNVMVGDPATIVISDTYQKGLTQFDQDIAWEAMWKSFRTPEDSNQLRPGNDAYLEYGYIPFGIENKKRVWGELSSSLEYNLADFALAQFANSRGKEDEHDRLIKQSSGYRHFFDSLTGFLRPKLLSAEFVNLLDTTTTGWPGAPGYVEGHAWNYSFFVPHDMEGLIQLYGSEQRFVDQLQKAFDGDGFSMGNEPDIAYPYLFNYVSGEEWRCQEQVQKAIRNNFKNQPDGLPGNDDCGTMSAWLVFSMMGLYPDCPGKPLYQLTTPSFDRIEIVLDQRFYAEDQFVITKNGNHSFIESIQLNNLDHPNYQLIHDELVAGGKLNFNTSDKPLK
ncbi:MAG: alpha-mannosidase [Flammeovirgaceae bacterium]|nr:alpha-mannosidase [Flammeovirgaceae bacterium]MBE61706.1 alpha-mannosidase [Flammeovirgaceae bacterium]